MSKILSKEGYLLDKSKFPRKITVNRKELIVKPYQTFKVPNMPLLHTLYIKKMIIIYVFLNFMVLKSLVNQMKIMKQMV